MTVPKDTIWEIEPHTLAKHEILRRYLGAWFPILSTYNQRVVYIDGFCGPGRYKGGEVGSPIIALDEAMKHSERLRNNKLTFLFMDERGDRIAHLKSELGLVSLPGNCTVRVITGNFEDEFRSLLDTIENKGLQIAPTFAFIDPFGFKGLPFELVHKLLKKPKTEVFVNVMIDSINRFLDGPDKKTKQHIVDLFGTSEALEVAKDKVDRIVALRLLYQRQLSKCAKFVRYFEMRNAQNRTTYYLFFATNHPLGHLKMKEAFWKVDPSSGFRFSDATDPDQLVLFEIDESPKLAKELHHHFMNRKLLVAHVQKFVENETPFIATHMRNALRLLEEQKKVSVDSYKSDGKKRLKNTYPENAVVQFSSCI
jgi:three-Cys-motif partner protein